MAKEFRFYKNKNLMTLNEIDEILCEVQGVEVDDRDYCNLYHIVTGAILRFSDPTRDSWETAKHYDNVAIVERLEELYHDRAWFKEDKEQLIEALQGITVQVI